MEKKLQVFISSTFLDLKEERQAAVQAVLNAGHIPAGMELFKAGDESQQQVIEEWINDSDVYLLILGGRYGALNNEGISYTEWEYNKATELNKERFSLILNEEYINTKVAQGLIKATDLETKNDKYMAFKERVEKKLVKYIDHEARIESSIQSSLRNIEKKKGEKLGGWVKYSDIENYKAIKDENSMLKTKLVKLTEKNSSLKEKEYKRNQEKDYFGDFSYSEIVDIFKNQKLILRQESMTSKLYDETKGEVSFLTIIETYYTSLSLGISSQTVSKDNISFDLYRKVLPVLKVYGLAESIKVEKNIQRLQLSKEGLRFFSRYLAEVQKKTTEN
ncbi:DUF4062 domain-containing protein [Carnobacterium maltaromaticum]|uniref:DUF4062 domain-containing protein n=1 Tax=Carnobacterium maltaromaticum TaxID=2751 RepID=UPI0039BDFE8C